MDSLVFDKKVFERFFLLIVIISSFFLLGSTYYSYSGAAGLTCRNEVEVLDPSVLSAFSDNFSLNNSNYSVTQSYDVRQDVFAREYNYCFRSVANVTPVSVEIINGRAEVIGNGFVASSGVTCLPVSNFSSEVGVRCVDCNLSQGKNLVLPKNTLGGDVPTGVWAAGVYTSSLNNYLDAEYQKSNSCSQRARAYDNYFLVLIALSLVGAFVLVGVNELGRMQFG